MIPLLIYICIFTAAFFIVTKVVHRAAAKDYTSLKTVTFGDESAVRPNRAAGVISILTIFLLWGIFTGSSLLPGFLHAPGPFVGTSTFTYTAQVEGQAPDDATVTVVVHPREVDTDAPEVEPGDGFAKNDSAAIAQWRTGLINVARNDDLTKQDGARVIAINGEKIAPGETVDVEGGSVTLTDKGTPNFAPTRGWQMEPLYLPSPEAVWTRSIEIVQDGFRNFTLVEHLGYSLFRVVVGFMLGALVGIPLGYAMGLSDWFRGWFDPIVEFMRPVPPLALIPLVIIWAGIGESGKIILLFLAALWIMAIAARSGVSGVKISKVHAAYSLGASKWQIMRYVIVPNSLPEIFTGARVAMGVCWGTVVAAELVAAEQGAGMMIMTASKFQNTDIVIMGIILIGVIGFGIDMLMRWAERILVPWKGKG
ncbi:ABC transporter permease [Roseobacter denitrificans]|uniref:Taurine ABC transporter, permease protein n=1 Tax=Roseobacter denitrificans (strain ATCC 33942 / OCh 114) TaxID=375451 RepID=Q16BJ2_ROSDO|nr:ABC transporter permease [Roseobacter denitrificans]ABG30651.1 taurine ABC transporter, permease protein [Roseobacter denitrificans OCh 114]AVL53782.1 ABC transporter permease [Roseobacter denitrificans]SFG18957.1 taurine transport system permease protein [Roseobacter denitrificans OCh 114]